jgi:hypothetical protein
VDLGPNNERLEDAKPELVHALRELVRQFRQEGVVARRRDHAHHPAGLAKFGEGRGEGEAALKGDRQLGEQIVQILFARRFDNETRAQVVRLIGDRARQLVPSVAKRVINDWTLQYRLC